MGRSTSSLLMRKANFDSVDPSVPSSGCKGQQYTCAIYVDDRQVPRVNLSFSGELTYKVVTNQFGERQGAVNAITT